MRKAYLIIVGIMIIFSLLSGCACAPPKNAIKSQGKIWGPLIKGLKWGMTEDEVLEALNCEECELVKLEGDNKFYSVSPAEKTSVYDIEMEYVVYLEEINDVIILSRIQFKIEEADIQALKEKLVKKYEGYEKLPGKPFVEDEPLVWYSIEPIELDNYEEVMEAIGEEYGDGLYYDAWAEGFSRRPLAWSILYEDNHEFWNNTLWVYGGTFSMIEYVLKQ